MLMSLPKSPVLFMFLFLLQGINGVSPIPDGYNPATWMLEVTTPAVEEKLGVDFAEIYQQSEQYR